MIEDYDSCAVFVAFVGMWLARVRCANQQRSHLVSVMDCVSQASAAIGATERTNSPSAERWYTRPTFKRHSMITSSIPSQWVRFILRCPRRGPRTNQPSRRRHLRWFCWKMGSQHHYREFRHFDDDCFIGNNLFA